MRETRARRRLHEEERREFTFATPIALASDECSDDSEQWSSPNGTVSWPKQWDDAGAVECDVEVVVAYINECLTRNRIQGVQLPEIRTHDRAEIMLRVTGVFERLLTTLSDHYLRAKGVVCLDSVDFLTHKCFAQYLTQGGFNQIFVHRFLNVVVRVGKQEKKTSLKRLKAQKRIIDHIQAREPTLLPQLFFHGIETLYARPVQIWERCEASCVQFLRQPLNRRLQATVDAVSEALHALAGCGYVNYDMKLSNMVYTVEEEQQLRCKVIDLDDRFMMDVPTLRRKTGCDDDDDALVTAMDVIMHTCVSVQNRKYPLGKKMAGFVSMAPEVPTCVVDYIDTPQCPLFRTFTNYYKSMKVDGFDDLREHLNVLAFDV